MDLSIMSSIRDEPKTAKKDREATLDKTKFYDDCVELVSMKTDLQQQLVNHVISLEEYRERVELVNQKANELIAI